MATNPASFAGLFAGNVQVTGTFSAAVKNAVVPFPDGSARVLHCMESPEHWFEDFGTAKLRRGRGLFVYRKSAASFEVRELMGGKSSIAFCYRIIGRRKDITRHRRFAKIDTLLPMRRRCAPSSPALSRRPARGPKRARKLGRSRPAERWSRRAGKQ